MNTSIVRYTCLLFLILVALLTFRTNLEDYDIWFHLKYGEHYAQNMTWNIDHSVYSWTPTSIDWKYVTWIGSSLLYLAHQAAGFPGLAVLQWCIYLSVFLLYYFYIKSLGEALTVVHSAALLLVTIALCRIAHYLKPELFTLLFFAAIVFIYFQAKSAGKNYFYLYPGIFLLWVNSHGGYIIGIFFIALILALEGMNYFFIRKNCLSKKLLGNLAISAFMCCLALLVNPYGIHYPIQTMQDLLFSSYTNYLPKIVAELNVWDYFLPKGINAYKIMYSAQASFIMAVALCALTLYVYAKDRFIDPVVLLANCIVFLLILKSARIVLFFPILWLFSITYVLSKTEFRQIRKILLPVALAVFLIFGGGYFYDGCSAIDYKSFFGSDVAEWVPEKEIAFIKENKLPGPIFNDYLIGSYMIWAMYPEYKVFMDSRYGPYVNQVLEDWFTFKSPMHLQKLREKYHFNTALIHLREPNVIRWFLSSGEWKAAYFDKVAVVFVHNTVFESLERNTPSPDLGAARFQDIDNPKILGALFDTYGSLNRAPDMFVIYEIFKNNVSEVHPLKDMLLPRMEKQLQLLMGNK